MSSNLFDLERAASPIVRPRRLRRTAALRAFVAETTLSAKQLVHPVFVRDGTNIDNPIKSLSGHSQVSVDRLEPAIDDTLALGIPAILIFGIPSEKHPLGDGAWSPNGPVPRAISAIKRQHPKAIVIADVCLCSYTTHGHCGVLGSDNRVDNDSTLPLLARAATAYADAGADIVAPSAMMDGQVGAIRRALDDAGHTNTAILSYAIKYASAFYGPFRDAAQSAPTFGDRKTYQMDPRNGRVGLREAALDVTEGADLIMVKPAGPYLDVIRAVRERFDLPLVAYQVSGEYAMLKAAAERGWIEEERAALETLLGIKRAGADVIITYYAKDAARWMAE